MNSCDSICLNCYFGEKELVNVDQGHYLSQTGCKLGKLEKHRRNGVEILDCVDPDNGNEFTVLKNFICRWGRNEKWVSDNVNSSGPFVEKDMRELVEEENEMVYQWILFDNSTREDLYARLHEIHNQEIQPKRVVVIRPVTSCVNPIKVGKWLGELFPHPEYKWTVENLAEDVSDSEGTDVAITKFKYPFYIKSYSDKEINETTSREVDDQINKEVLVFGILKLRNVEVVATSVHVHFQGSMFGETLEEKIKRECPEKIIQL